jgi:hypothetical protein
MIEQFWTETKYWLAKLNHPRIIIGLVVLFIVVATFSVTFQQKTSFQTFIVQRPLLIAEEPRKIAFEDAPWDVATMEDLFPGAMPVEVFTKQGAKIIDGVRATGDFDHDGEEDIIEATEEQMRLALSSREEDLWQITHNKDLASVGFDDVNGDGLMDAWYMDRSQRFVTVFWGTGGGKDAKKRSFFSNLVMPDYTGLMNGSQLFDFYDVMMPEWATFYDVDSDGQMDILMAGQATDEKRPDPDAPWSLYWVRLKKPEKDQ